MICLITTISLSTNLKPSLKSKKNKNPQKIHTINEKKQKTVSTTSHHPLVYIEFHIFVLVLCSLSHLHTHTPQKKEGEKKIRK